MSNVVRWDLPVSLIMIIYIKCNTYRYSKIDTSQQYLSHQVTDYCRLKFTWYIAIAHGTHCGYLYKYKLILWYSSKIGSNAAFNRHIYNRNWSLNRCCETKGRISALQSIIWSFGYGDEHHYVYPHKVNGNLPGYSQICSEYDFCF